MFTPPLRAYRVSGSSTIEVSRDRRNSACEGGRPAHALRAVVQRVARASSAPGGAIGAGVCVLLGVADGDDEAAADRLAGKVARLRIFEDEAGKFDRSLLDTGGEALVVSQVTLIADTRKGNRPSFDAAAPPAVAEPVYERFAAALRELGVEVETGVFGTRMQIEIVNDGPVTIVLDV
jgi:D-tyrosyl-tRNA(Tyr) deacylase